MVLWYYACHTHRGIDNSTWTCQISGSLKLKSLSFSWNVLHTYVENIRSLPAHTLHSTSGWIIDTAVWIIFVHVAPFCHQSSSKHVYQHMLEWASNILPSNITNFPSILNIKFFFYSVQPVLCLIQSLWIKEIINFSARDISFFAENWCSQCMLPDNIRIRCASEHCNVKIYKFWSLIYNWLRQCKWPWHMVK